MSIFLWMVAIVLRILFWYNQTFVLFSGTIQCMEHIIVGLGNPGEEYGDTRHNIGRIVVERFRKQHDFSDWEKRKELKAFVSRGSFEGHAVTLLEPDDYMNNSGKSVARYLKDANEETLVVVVHDDIDLPIGTFRISFNRGAGGHNGVLSVEQEIKTREFIRVRIGIAPVTFFGTMRKPKGEVAVQKHVLGKFTTSDAKKLEPVLKDSVSAIEQIVNEGHTVAMNRWN